MTISRFDTHVHVKQVSGMLYDVFWGKGWDTWGRVEIQLGHKPHIAHVLGLVLPFHIRNALIRYLRLTP